MASVSFVSPEREERAWDLDPSHPSRIGRDADNDIVLRDPRVSRHHARVVFEKGFFVVYDLASANGTFVNGKRIQVAPLVNGVQIRMGNTTGRFSDDPAADQHSTVVDQPIDAPGAAAESEGTPEGEPATTNPFPKGEAPSERSADPGEGTFAGSRYVIELASQPAAVRNGVERPIFYFERPPRLIGWVGGLIAAMIGATGLTAAVVLTIQGRPLHVLATIGLTIAFAALILNLVPRKEIFFCRDEEMSQVALVLRQEHRIPIPSSEYRAVDPAGRVLATFRKNHWSNLGRRRWWILSDGEMAVGWAEEDSLPRAMARKVASHAIRAFRSNYRFIFEGKFVGRIERREGRDLLDLAKDPDRHLDRRVAIPLSVLILAVEGK
ncbi:MAG TPA: FHA domain-containing protein [Thermoanaerobaculia bacterium]|nr:FHA domain-containing protein [Thermoanaerobaculia bacterium]